MVGRVPQWCRRSSSALVAGLVMTLTAVSCGGSAPELTTAEMLEKLEGRPLTQAEVDERLALADLLCGFENRVLTRMWDDLGSEELEFQDWVFGQHCPDRLTAYSAARPSTGTAPPTSTTTAPDEPDVDDESGDPDGFFNRRQSVGADDGPGDAADDPAANGEDPITSITGTTVIVGPSG